MTIKAELRLTNEDCKLLTSMDGEEIRRELPMMLAVGLGSCLEKMADGGGMRTAFATMLDDMEVPQEIQDEMFEPMLPNSTCAKHELSFEITEYLEPESMASLASAVAVMTDAFFSGSTITIE